MNAKLIKVEKIEKKIKYIAFGKTKPSNKMFKDSKKCKQCRLLGCNPSPEGSLKTSKPKCMACRTQDEKDENLLKRQADRLENAINNIKEKKLGRAGSIYKMKAEIVGHKKAQEEASAIRDPTSNELIVAKERINEVTLEYVVNNLKGNTPDEAVKDVIELRRSIQHEKMRDKSGETFDISKEDFDNVLAKFKRKPTKTYYFLIKSGIKYQEAIFELCKDMIEKE